ncbi:hypothetical protein REPUB_Repub12eG0197400 [Reevesia pubescens]
MSMMKPGVTFLMGTMFGALLTRGFTRCHHLKEIRGGNWRCPRRVIEKKSGEANLGTEVEKQTTESLVSRE